MDVVPAGMHDRDVVAVGIEASICACVREPGPLVDGEPVHVGAEQDHGPVAVPQLAHDAGPPDPGRHLEAEGGETLGDDAGRANLSKAQLGVAVEVPVQRGPVGAGRHVGPISFACGLRRRWASMPVTRHRPDLLLPFHRPTIRSLVGECVAAAGGRLSIVEGRDGGSRAMADEIATDLW